MQVFILVWDDGMTLDPTATVKQFMIYISTSVAFIPKLTVRITDG